MNKKNNNNKWKFEISKSNCTIISSGIFTGICVWGFLHAADYVTRIVIIPIFICAFAVLIKDIIILIKTINLRVAINNDDVSTENALNKNEKLNIVNKIISKFYVFGFLLFWFGFLILFDYIAIKQREILYVVGSIIFWIIGIKIAINNFK